MGYSERECVFCRVSFNIGRIRKPGEPYSQGWTSDGDGKFWVETVEFDVCKQAGCKEVKKAKYPPRDETESEKLIYTQSKSTNYRPDDEDDSEYVPGDSDEDDDLEYESDDGIGDSSDKDSEEDADEITARKEHLYYLATNLLQDKNNFLNDESNVKGDIPSDLLDDGEEDGDATRRVWKYEHVAEPACEDDRAYNGYHITSEEMRGCNTSQSITERTADWKPLLDDLPYESHSACAFSGLSGWMPSFDTNFPEFMPARHGPPGDYFDDFYGTVLFHPSCFDIFVRLSRLHFGQVELDELMRWRERIERNQSRKPILNNDVTISSRQHWQHINGCEYLAANPLHIPHLAPIMTSALDHRFSFNPQAGAFENSSSVPPGPTAPDCLNTLPQELKLEILCYLESKDIASLRLASRAFTQLPISLWRQLLLKEMPWLWETWSDETPFVWACVKWEDIDKIDKNEQKIRDELLGYRLIIREEMPELLDDWKDAEKRFVATKSMPTLLAKAKDDALGALVCGLPPNNTNWYELYSGITRDWDKLKGLKNRARIWDCVEQVIDDIKKHREQISG